MVKKEVKKVVKTPSAHEYPLLIKQLLITPLINNPEKEIVYRDKLRYTYRELADRINRLASALEKLGVEPGDTVAVMDWDSHRYLECFFAIPMMGAILHTVNIRLPPEQILYTMNHADDKVVLVNEEFLPIVEALKDKFTTVEKYVLLKEGEETPKSSVPFAAEYEEMIAGAPNTFEFEDFDENAQATMFYTTGTTGDPKGVYYSHRQLVLHTISAAVMLAGYTSPGRFNSDDVYMPITPMFHVHAWGVPYLATLLGCKHVYPGKYEPGMLLKLKETEGVTFSHCVPTILHMLLSSPAAKQMDLKGWKIIIGGSALPRGLAKLALSMGIEVFTGYGMSETCPILTIANQKPYMFNSDLESQLDVRTMTGLPVPLVDIKIGEVGTNRRLPMDGKSAGEIQVRAPWLTMGYHKDPVKSEELWEGGYLHTGDIAMQDAEGYVKITDRLKDVIKTGGEWISSLHLESLISQHEAVSECAVVGVPDDKWGERPLAMVVTKQDYIGKLGPEDLRTFMEKYVADGSISKWGVPDSFLMVDQIPKTSVGKIDKKVIKKNVAEKV